MEMRGGRIAWILLPFGNCLLQLFAIGAETLRQGLKKSDPRPGRQIFVFVEDMPRQSDARGFAPPRQQPLA
jgi:hypothetical protein